MIGPTPFRDILLIAWYEILEMMRTRRALVLTLLYLLGAFMAVSAFISMVSAVENTVAKALGAGQTSTPGAMMKQILASKEYGTALRAVFPDRETADYLLTLPPIVLFYAWSSFWMAPLFITLTATDSIAQEVQTRGIRFTLFRTGRIEFVVGKVLGQAGLMVVVLLLTAGVYLGKAAYHLYGFELMPALQGMAVFFPRVVIYAWAFAGLCAMFSMNARTTSMARALALIGLSALWFLDSMIEAQKIIPSLGLDLPIWDLVSFLLPFSHQDSLWRPDLQVAVSNGLILFALGFLYVSIGLALFSRRDI